MAHFVVAGRTSAVPTAARGPSVYATAAVRPEIRSIEVYNTTAVAVAVSVHRATATGTKGTAITPHCSSDDSHVALCTGANTHSVDATLATVPVKQASLGAAIGSGIIWTWGPGEFVIDNATTAGVVIACPTGTGQHLDFSIEFVE